MPIHEMDGHLSVVEIRADADVTVDSGGDVFTVTFTDPGEPFGRPKPNIRLIMTCDKALEMLSAMNPGFLWKAMSDPFPHI